MKLNTEETKALNNKEQDGSTDKKRDDGDKDVGLKKEIGLLGGVSIILGIIIGSGIFISPKGVMKETKSVGLTLVVWVISGVLAMVGAVCYAELGTTIPRSGGDYAYLHEIYGPLPAFLYLWDANVVFVPVTNAIMGLTFAQYVVEPLLNPLICLPPYSIRLIAGATILFLTFLNCYNVKITSRMQNVFMFAKVAGLATIIIAGVVHVSGGNTENFKEPFAGSQTDVGKIAASFYSGLYSYAGWSYLNFMTEELKNPYVNLPKAIYISLPLVTTLYVLANVGYLAVMNYDEVMYSDAIALTLGNKLLGSMAWIMPVFVAVSVFGGLSVHIMTSSRLLFTGARNGHFPRFLSLVSVERSTPVPALVFLALLSLLYLSMDIITLIDYSSFVEASFILLTVSGLIWLRIKKPDLPRPIKVNIILPIIFVLISSFLVILPIFARPHECGWAILITATGLPIYFLFIHKQPKWLEPLNVKMTRMIQQVFVTLPEDAVCNGSDTH